MFNKISFFCISPWLFSQIIYAKEYLWINAQKRLINLVLLRNVLINFQSYLILSLFKECTRLSWNLTFLAFLLRSLHIILKIISVRLRFCFKMCSKVRISAFLSLGMLCLDKPQVSVSNRIPSVVVSSVSVVCEIKNCHKNHVIENQKKRCCRTANFLGGSGSPRSQSRLRLPTKKGGYRRLRLRIQTQKFVFFLSCKKVKL